MWVLWLYCRLIGTRMKLGGAKWEAPEKGNENNLERAREDSEMSRLPCLPGELEGSAH